MVDDKFQVAIVGCGRPLRTDGATGFGMAHRHMEGYKGSGRCQLVAVADINRANAEAFVEEHNPSAQVFSQGAGMANATRPDIVSVCVWPNLHSQIVCALAPYKPKVIFCEKPMDIHWEGALKMHEVCQEHGVQLVINHQRRFNRPFVRARELMDEGAIGTVRSIEGAWHNLSDSGTHIIDMMFYFNHDLPVDWVLGQIDTSQVRRVFGAINAGHGISEFRFSNGVRATYSFGYQHQELGCLMRIQGTDGIIEILNSDPWLRMHQFSKSGWRDFPTGENIHDDKAIYRGISNFIDAIDQGEMPELSSSRALQTTEVIFATHQSARIRGRVDLPLAPGPCAMLEMIEAGELKVQE